MLSKIIFSMLLSATAYAQNSATCFQATNPEKMTIATIDEGRAIVATQASMKISPEIDENNYAMMTMSITGKTGEQIKIMGFDFNQTKGAEFRVECDGGGVQFANGESRSLVANTGYIAGEIVNVGGEGCGMVRIAMDEVRFEQKACTQE